MHIKATKYSYEIDIRVLSKKKILYYNIDIDVDKIINYTEWFSKRTHRNFDFNTEFILIIL